MSQLVGLDIGYLNLRAVAFRRGKAGWQVSACAEAARFDEQGERKTIGRALAELDSKLPLRGQVTVSCSDLSAMVRFEHNDPLPPDRLERLLHLTLVQHAGTEGDLAADAVAIPLAGDLLVHCCGLAQPPQVVALIGELAKAGVRPDRVSLPAAAIANTLRHLPPEQADEEGCALLVDLGARSTRVALTRGRDFLACRQLAFGSDLFTEALAKARSLRFHEAERLKRDGAGAVMPQSGVAPAAASASSSDDERLDFDDEPGAAPSRPPADPAAEPVASAPALFLEDAAALAAPAPEEPAPAPVPPSEPAAAENLEPWQRRSTAGSAFVPPDPPAPAAQTMVIAAQVLGPELARPAEDLYVQVAKTVSWFQAQLRMKKLDVVRVRICGGGADLAGLRAYLQRRFKVPVEVFDPCALAGGATVPDGHRFALACGLALAGVPGAVAMDLRPESVQRRDTFRREVVWPWVAAAMVLLATVLAWAGLWRSQAARQDEQAAYQRFADEHDRLRREFEKQKAVNAGMRDDMREIASRLYGGRDLLYAIRALKENAPRDLWLTSLTTGGLQGGDEAVDERPRGRSKAPPPEAGANTIDRGHIVVEGFVKPEASTADRFASLRIWREKIVGWRRPVDGTPLFREEKLNKVIVDAEKDPTKAKDELSFEEQFFFSPTVLGSGLAAEGRP